MTIRNTGFDAVRVGFRPSARHAACGPDKSKTETVASTTDTWAETVVHDAESSKDNDGGLLESPTDITPDPLTADAETVGSEVA